MTEGELTAMLLDAGAESLPRTPAGLSELEARAAARPGTRALERAVLVLHDRLEAERTPAVVGGIRRDRLVRWDRHTTTWVGTDVATAEASMVRHLRPAAASDPVIRRWFHRTAAALQPLLSPRLVEGGDALMVPLGGPPAAPPAAHHPEVVAWWAGAVRGVGQWEQAGRGLPWLAPSELRATEAGARVVCLTPGPGVGVAGALASLAQALDAPTDDHALTELVATLRSHPPATCDEALERLRPALARVLAAERHRLAERWQQGLHARRAARLLGAVRRLHEARPPPSGRGAVGVDLDGRITVVETRDHSIWWGPEDEMIPVYRPLEGFDAPTARRLLRARAAAPPNPALDRQVGGDSEAVEVLTRWVAAGLRLRTVKLLLEKA